MPRAAGNIGCFCGHGKATLPPILLAGRQMKQRERLVCFIAMAVTVHKTPIQCHC